MENAGKAWELKDLILLANTAPTEGNIKTLSKALGRTEKAITSQFYLLYCATSYLREEDGSISEQHKKIIKARKAAKLKIAIGKNKPTQ